MRWKSKYKHPKGLYFIIEQQTLRNVTDQKDQLGFYLYIYTHIDTFNIDLNDPNGDCRSYQDSYLQDSLEIAQEQALGEFGLPLDSWKQVEE